MRGSFPKNFNQVLTHAEHLLNIEALFQPLQVWVSPGYTRYRQAWRRALGDSAIREKVLHHVFNRRMAKLRGFGFIRLAPGWPKIGRWGSEGANKQRAAG